MKEGGRIDIHHFKVDGIVSKAKIYRKWNRRDKCYSTIYYVDAHLPNLDKSIKRLDRSTKKTDKALALKEAKKMIKEAYKHRLSFQERERNVSNETLAVEIIEQWIDDVKHNRPKRSRGRWNQDSLKTHRRNLQNHILPYLKTKPPKHWNELDVKNMVDSLRDFKKISEKSIANVRTTFRYLWDYAKLHGIVNTRCPKFPQIKIVNTTKEGLPSTYGYAEPVQVLDAISKIEKASMQNSLTDNQRHKLYVYAQWWKLLLDTGMRPMMNTPLPLIEETRNETNIFFKRNEKGIIYTAKGKQTSSSVVDDLKDYYKSNKIKNKELIVGLDGERMTLKSQEILWKQVCSITDWGKHGKLKDKYGRLLVPYSIRHCHITYALRNGEVIEKVAKRCGTSVEMIMKYYYEHDFYDNTPSPSPFDATP